MAIGNYGELKTSANVYMFHQRFVPQYDNATLNFETVANRRLRVRQMETSTLLTTVAGEVALPTDYLLWRTVLWTGMSPKFELEYVHPAYLESTAVGTTGSAPQLFTIEGTLLKTRPIADTVDGYEFHYYQKVPTLTGTTDLATNWLLTAYPDVYLEGVLTELGALGRNLEFAQLHKARRDELFAEIIQLSALTTGATSPKVRQAEYF